MPFIILSLSRDLPAVPGKLLRINLESKRVSVGGVIWWLSAECRGDTVQCFLNAQSGEGVKFNVAGFDLMDDVSRTRRREFEWNISVAPRVNNKFMLFYERMLSESVSIALVLNICQADGIRIHSFNLLDSALDGSNVCFRINDMKIYAHRELLAFHSPVFEAMFSCHFIEGSQSEINLKHLNPDEFIHFLNILYHNDYDIDELSVKYLLSIADQFDVPVLKSFCERHMILNITKSNVKDMLDHAKRFQLINLKSKILTGNFSTINVLARVENNLLPSLPQMTLSIGLPSVDQMRIKTKKELPVYSENDFNFSKNGDKNVAIFQVENKHIFINSKILSIFTPGLYSIWEKKKDAGEPIEVPNISYKSFLHILRLLLHFASPRESINEFSIEYILPFSVKYECTCLKNMCQQFLQTYVGDAITHKRLLDLSIKYKFQEIQDLVYERIAEIGIVMDNLLHDDIFSSFPSNAYAIEETYGYLKRRAK